MLKYLRCWNILLWNMNHIHQSNTCEPFSHCWHNLPWYNTFFLLALASFSKAYLVSRIGLICCHLKNSGDGDNDEATHCWVISTCAGSTSQHDTGLFPSKVNFKEENRHHYDTILFPPPPTKNQLLLSPMEEEQWIPFIHPTFMQCLLCARYCDMRWISQGPCL